MKTCLLLIFYLAVTLQIKAQTVSDVDGNTYNTVTIGSQVWMKENLRTNKYNDGVAIPNVTGATAWDALSTPAYCWFNNDAATYKATYGAYYNWYVVNTGKICPIGWHVPTTPEWTTLITYLGGENVAGGKLKEAGTSHWLSPNQGADNSSGFTGLPGGFRDSNNKGSFDNLSLCGLWWSSTESHAAQEWIINLAQYVASTSLTPSGDKQDGINLRCLKDSSSVDLITVTFNVDGGSTVPNATVTKNNTINQPSNPTKSGYTFAGWYKETDCNNAWNFTTDVVSAPVTLYAKWTKMNTSVNIQTTANYKLYPNPAKEKIYIHSNSGNASGAIFNLQGERVIEIMADATQIDVSSLPKGVYIVMIISSGDIFVDKLIKE